MGKIYPLQSVFIEKFNVYTFNMQNKGTLLWKSIA